MTIIFNKEKNLGTLFRNGRTSVCPFDELHQSLINKDCFSQIYQKLSQCWLTKLIQIYTIKFLFSVFIISPQPNRCDTHNNEKHNMGTFCHRRLKGCTYQTYSIKSSGSFKKEALHTQCLCKAYFLNIISIHSEYSM